MARGTAPTPAFTIIGSFLGTQLLLNVDPEPFRLLLAVVLIAYLVSDHLHHAAQAIEVPPWGMAAFGLLPGLLSGVVNIFAPLVEAHALYIRMRSALMVATFNLTFVTSKSGQILGFVSQGAFDLEVIGLTLLTLPVIRSVLWLDIRVRKRIDIETYRGLLRGSLLHDALRRL